MIIENYTLFISQNCSCCNSILKFINTNKIDIKTINIDKEIYSLPFSLMIIPALIENDKLVGYGPDILTFLERFKSKKIN